MLHVVLRFGGVVANTATMTVLRPSPKMAEGSERPLTQLRGLEALPTYPQDLV